MTVLSVLLLLTPLTACETVVIANDPNDQCAHPDKPSKPYTDKKVALLVIGQAKAIDVCRGLLGHGKSK